MNQTEDFSPCSGCSSPSSLLVRMKNTFLHFEETFLESPRGSRVRSVSDSSCGSGRRGRRLFEEEGRESEFVMVFEEDERGKKECSSASTRNESLIEGAQIEITTVMLRNIPNKYTQKKLMEVINEKGFVGRYDFFYLPMDFRHNCNLGFAFVNLDSEETRQEFTDAFEGFQLPGFNSNKVCQVSLARVQGLQANMEHYKNSPVAQVTIAEYKPVVLPLGQP